MNIERAELLRTWVAALRSGKYPQTGWFFRDDKGYCAVGVLVDVGGQAEWRRSRRTQLYHCNMVTVEFLFPDDDEAGRYMIGAGSLTSDGNAPCCIYGHAWFLAGVQGVPWKKLAEAGIAPIDDNDATVQRITKSRDGRISFRRWCKELNVVRGK